MRRTQEANFRFLLFCALISLSATNRVAYFFKSWMIVNLEMKQ